jgi:hypothetical protein
VLIAAVLLCTFLYVLGIPIIYWLAFGEGVQTVTIEGLPINIFIGNWGALIITLFCYAKSYLITIIIVFILYLFRLQMGNLMIN